MRFIAALLFLVSTVFSAAAASPTAVNVVRLWTGYRTADSFERISEYFTGRENPGRQTVLRSQPASRAGYYFLLRLANTASAPTEATVELQIIAPTSPEPRKYTFKTTLPIGTHVVSLGLTGADWPSQANPVAWLIVVRATDGTELVHQQSFLWAKPDKS